MSDPKDKLRERHLLHLFLFLNVGLVGAFAVYLSYSHSDAPRVVPTPFLEVAPARTNRATSPAPAPPATVAKPAPLPVIENPPSVEKPLSLASAAVANSSPPVGPSGTVPFTWREIESPEYIDYIGRLRAAGCPADKVQAIVMEDVNDLFAQKRLKEAAAHDPPWWRSQPDPYGLPAVLRDKGRWLEEQRRSMIGHLLGAAAVPEEKEGVGLWSHQPLTGSVLGALSIEKHLQVQEICAQAMERRESAVFAQANGDRPVENVELARLREKTRADLRQVLSLLELEEFLLRYSHIAYDLRIELTAFNPTEQEFRKIFRAIDPIDHQVQVELGGADSLSAQQRERWRRQRDLAIKEALGAERYQTYGLATDPLFRQAQMYVTQFNAPPETVTPIYQVTKAGAARRQRILKDATLTAEQRSQALNAMDAEQMQSIRKLIAETSARR